jgi:hypothetical protein
MMLPAPGLFSTTNCRPICFDSASAVMRAMVSVPPPGGDGTIMRTGFVG